MSNPGEADATPITSLRQLADFIAVGSKPAEKWRIGTEHEKFGFRGTDYSMPAYEPRGIRAVLEGLAQFGAEPILDRGNPIGLKQGAASISLEPAGQLELSGAAVETLHETHEEMQEHFRQVRAVSEPLDLGFAPLGFHPFYTREQMPWMPKGRYAIMRAYMPKVGTRGLDMMTRTCTVQVNLDYGTEDDMRRKLRLSLALQPLATALFANSPFLEGKPTGLQSGRAHAWLDTDNARSGIPQVMFDPAFDFLRYATWMVDEVPMYFVYRDGKYIDVAGASFRAFMEGKVPALAGQTATMGDFADHMTTVFTDVRLKRFLEMRGADAGSPAMMVAQSALWVGLLYDDAATAAAEKLAAKISWQDAVALRDAVPAQGLAAKVPSSGASLRDIGRDALAIARDGLRARGRKNAAGRDEAIYLDPLDAIIAGAPNQAEHWLARFHGAWAGDVRRIFTEAAV